MTAHDPHPDRDERSLPILHDGCARCEEQAEELGLHLDNERWQQAWYMMLSVEFSDGGGGYKSDADKKLGRQLYYMALILQRQGLDPRRLLLPPVARGA